MFKCCGCPSKKGNRTTSEDEDEPKEASNEPPQIQTPAPPTIEVTKCAVQENGIDAAEPVKPAEPVQPEEIKTEPDANVEPEPVAELTERKSSMKKPKPRLSISAEIQIIPGNFDFDDDDVIDDNTAPMTSPDPELRSTVAERGSPLSDEVFAGTAFDPPRPNLGVSPSHMDRAVGVEFPRSPLLTVDQAVGLDVPMSPRGKAPTPHPVKRASMPAVLPRWLSEEEDEGGGSHEPPVTPVARDELALRRHRFFSDLLAAAQAATEHRVRFDPLGPEVAREPESANHYSKDLDALLERLENITARLEKTVPILEEKLEPLSKTIVVTKSLEDLLDEHLTPTEKEKISSLINEKIAISSDSSADVEDFSDKELDKAEQSFDRNSNQVNDQETTDNEEEEAVAEEEGNGVIEEIVKASDSRPECENGELSDRDSSEPGEQSSESPPTVVCDIPNGDLPPDLLEINDMTNSQSTLNNMSVQGFTSILQGPFATYLQLSSKIGGDVSEHARIVEKAFQAQMQYLVLASQSKKPSPNEEGQLLTPTSQQIQAIQEYREKHRTSPHFNHLSAISESIPALGWVTISPAPSPFVKEMNDAGQFYTNRVLKDWKEKDKTHVEWSKAWVQTLTELQGFVKQYHTTGLVWSGTGSAVGRAGPPPPPSGPMPPPPPPLDLNMADIDLGANDRSALFAEINRGGDVTRGLKKVTSDMQTHKNSALRSGPAPFKATSLPSSKPQAAPAQLDKPPVFARDGKKWLVEYQKNNPNIVIDGAEMNNVVYAFRCQDSTITVKGKINSIFVDSCKKVAVVFDSVVSSVEFVNCQSVQMQVLGNVPTISVDKTDGCQMYLSDASLGVSLISSKSSEMNILVPKGNGDYTEFAVPEQYRTTVSKKGLTTVVVESTG